MRGSGGGGEKGERREGAEGESYERRYEWGVRGRERRRTERGAEIKNKKNEGKARGMEEEKRQIKLPS